MKVRIKFCKYGMMKFIGHLDMMRFFQKALRRAEIPVKYTEGYSPHMVMSFASPLGVGLTSDGEYFDLELTEEMEEAEALERLNREMVEGVKVLRFFPVPGDKKNKAMTLVEAASWTAFPAPGLLPENWKSLLSSFFQQKEILITKETKRSSREVNIRPLIYQLEPEGEAISMLLAAGSRENLKPELVTGAFCSWAGIPVTEFSFTYHRKETFARTADGELAPLDALTGEES